MNVIFIDYDGVFDTVHLYSDEDIEKRVMILADICKEYDCKVVISSSLKDAIFEDTMETESRCFNYLFSLFKKYGIECIGRTPTVEKKISEYSYYPVWKEDEILLYLKKHPEIEHYCVIDDDEYYPVYSDLDKVRDHLIRPLYSSRNPEEEGILPKHKEEVGIILKKQIKKP